MTGIFMVVVVVVVVVDSSSQTAVHCSWIVPALLGMKLISHVFMPVAILCVFSTPFSVHVACALNRP